MHDSRHQGPYMGHSLRREALDAELARAVFADSVARWYSFRDGESSSGGTCHECSPRPCFVLLMELCSADVNVMAMNGRPSSFSIGRMRDGHRVLHRYLREGEMTHAHVRMFFDTFAPVLAPPQPVGLPAAVPETGEVAECLAAETDFRRVGLLGLGHRSFPGGS